MITGDHPKTALAIGAALGLTTLDGEVHTGPEIDAMSDEQLKAAVLTCNVYARASPENKIRIVKSLQSHGQVVSMTGDGVNDAPSLKAANIGVAMVRGTAFASDAAFVLSTETYRVSPLQCHARMHLATSLCLPPALHHAGNHRHRRV